MGASVSGIWSNRSSDPALDIPDPSTGMTPREKQYVKDTWELVKKDLKATGVYLFISLFKKHPEYQKQFRAIADIPLDELATNKRLAAHALNVMYAITSMVDNLDDPECLTEVLLKIGSNHRNRRVKSIQFENVAVVTVEILEEKLGSVMTKEAKAAWVKTFAIINSIIFKTLNGENPK